MDRFDKNGIRILDPIKQTNQIVNPTKCLPGRHRYSFKESRQNGAVAYECRWCGDIEVSTEIDEQNSPEI